MPLDFDVELEFIEEWLTKTKHVEDCIEPIAPEEQKKHLDEINFDEEIYRKSKIKEFLINGIENKFEELEKEMEINNMFKKKRRIKLWFKKKKRKVKLKQG